MISRIAARLATAACAVVGSIVVACGGAGGGASSAPAPAGGDAARIICEAECRRDARCGHPEPGCNERCARLPVRSPPVWRTDWASELAGCIERADCAHDGEEACVEQTRFRATAAATCAATVAPYSRAARGCAVLNGLTPDVDRAVESCLRQRAGRECSPPYDWK